MFTELMQGKKVGLVARPPVESPLGDALRQAGIPFAQVDANEVNPGEPQLERYDALIVEVDGNADATGWLRPEIARRNSRPLLLAGEREAIYCRVALQIHAGDVIFSPYSSGELAFRLYRLIVGSNGHGQSDGALAKLCVLVADDDRDIVVYLKSILQNFDVEMHFASDGRAALEAARRLLPDLLLLDVEMPLLSGLDVLRCLREDPGTRPIVTALLTASSDLADVKIGADLGCVDYILKPFSHLDLTRKLRSLLERQAPVSERPHGKEDSTSTGRIFASWPGRLGVPVNPRAVGLPERPVKSAESLPELHNSRSTGTGYAPRAGKSLLAE